MKTQINPQESSRAQAYELWMTSPMPMVTLTKQFDVSNLIRISKRSSIKFNTLLCWCIAKAASDMKVFYTLPEQGELYLYDRIGVNVIVKNSKGGINSCDIAFNNDFQLFVDSYNTLTKKASAECRSYFEEAHMIVGTSAMIQTELNSIVNQYTDKFCNPMVMWGRYRQGWFRTTLPISFQFHHVQMDGGDGAEFLEKLQQEIASLKLFR